MTKVKLADLPAKVRAQIEEQTKTTTRPAKSRKGTGEGAPCPGTCGNCGEAFPTALAWGKHFEATGHGIWRIAFD